MLSKYGLSDDEYKYLVAFQWILTESHQLNNKPSDYYMDVVMYLLWFIRDNMYPKKEDNSIFTVILYAVVLFKHNYSRFYFLALIVNGGPIKGDRAGRNTLRGYLKSVRKFYTALPVHMQLPQTLYSFCQGVFKVCETLLMKGGMRALQYANLGLDDIAYQGFEHGRVTSTDIQGVTVPVFERMIEFTKLVSKKRNKKNKTYYDPTFTQATYWFGAKPDSYNAAWVINVLVILLGIFVIPKKWEHLGLSLKHDGYGGCGVLSRKKFKRGSELFRLLQVVNKIDCDIFVEWGGLQAIHARDYGIDLCFQEKLLKDIRESVDDETNQVTYPTLNPKKLPTPSHLRGSIPGILSGLAPWMNPVL